MYLIVPYTIFGVRERMPLLYRYDDRRGEQYLVDVERHADSEYACGYGSPRYPVPAIPVYVDHDYLNEHVMIFSRYHCDYHYMDGSIKSFDPEPITPTRRAQLEAYLAKPRHWRM